MFPKEFIVEDGQIYYRKKPLYRQPLFWTSIVGLIVSLLLAMLTVFLLLALVVQSDNEVMNENHGTTSEAIMDWSGYDEYSIGETAKLADVSIKVESMTVKDEDTLVDDRWEQALVVTLTLENTSHEDYYFDSDEFTVYGEDTSGYYVLDYRTYKENIPEKIKSGEEVHLKLYYGVDESDIYRFTYKNIYWDINNDVKVI